MRKILLCLVFICIGMCAYADETCDQSLIEAKQKYNAGNYAKAKALFEFVRDECGSNYGDVNSWISKCNSALNPSLSLSRSSISFGASSNTSSISVTSNRNWNIRSSGANWFSTSVSGNTINVSCSSNSSSSSRASYFDVITSDGAKSVRVSVSQSGASSSSTSLSVSRTTLSVSSAATTEYLTVSCNSSWEIQYPSATMYSVTRSGNTLTVKINANTSTESRSDFFNIKTTDGSKSVKVTLNQSGKTNTSSTTPSQYQVDRMTASISSAYIEHNVMFNGEKNMKFHVHFSVDNMKGYKGYVIVWIYDSNGNSQTSYRTDAKYEKNINNSHTILAWETIEPRYESSEWKDFILYFPNALLSKGGYAVVEIREYSTGKTLALSNHLTFTYGK